MRRSLPESRWTKCRRYCRLFTTFLFSHVGLCGLVVGYSIVGAFTFEALESGFERRKRDSMLLERQSLVDDLWNITLSSVFLSEVNWSLRASQTLVEFEGTLIKAVRKEGYDGKDESPLQWTFTGALLYSIIVITTIGYGNIAPKTPWGKVITILYAIVGIPLLLLCLSNIGDAMAHSFRFIYWKVCCYFCIRPKKRRKKQKQLTTFSLPVIRPCSSTNLRIQQPSQLSPNQSTSSFFTVPVASEGDTSPPDLTSPGSSPVSLSPPADDSSYVAHPAEVAQASIISNKYVLQSEDGLLVDAAQALSSSSSSPDFRTIPIFTITSAHQQNRCQEVFQCTNGPLWNHTPQPIDLGLMEDDRRSASPTPESYKEELSVPMWLCLALVVSYICGGAVLFTFWEKWNFLDSSYFCFVTLTTIGFGDLVPGTAVISDDNQLTLGLCSLYLLFGMALLAMSFNLVQEEVTRSVRCIGQRIGIIPDDEDN